MKKREILSVLATVLLSIAAANAEEQQIARLYSKEGLVQAQPAPGQQWQSVEVGAEFRLGAAVRVGKHGRAAIMFADGTLVRMSNNATIVFDRPLAAGAAQTSLKLNQGRLHLFSRNAARHPDVVTPVITAAIHGTEFVIAADADTTTVAVIQGAVEGANRWGSVVAAASERIEAVRGRAPVKALLVDPVGAVQWSLYYPPVLSFEDFPEFAIGATAPEREAWQALQRGDAQAARTVFAGSSWRDAIGRSLAALAQGDRAAALQIIEGYGGQAPASLLLYKGSLHLSFGEVPEAEAALAAAEQRIAQAPPEARGRLRAAHDAQRAVLALTRNDAQGAAELSARALAADASSPSAALTRSYVEQARSNLDEARRQAAALVAEHPHSAPLRVRLAELELSFDEVEEAERQVREALALDPRSSLAYTTLGFVRLFKYEFDAAAAAFDKAIGLDSGNALAYLGRGLVLVRRADLAGGRAAIEQAVHLAPGTSLYRSYLGKAFFDQDDEERAAEEYELALKLDPDDPTPYLYRAFNELAQNKVVSALQDVEASIERNQNRAIYRSRLLLDRDLGARSADLAQVFNELGFSQAARVEAIKSINTHYGNFSAHRLLAQSYRTILLGRAQLSEQQISNLLAPLSFNVLNNTTSDLSLNEYTSLFDKIEQRTGVNLRGETYDDYLLGEAFHTGRTEQLGYLMSVTGQAERGSKEHNYVRDNRLRLAGQYQPDYENRLLLDSSLLYRSSRFDAQQDVPTEDEFHGGDVNLGYLYRISPQSSLIAELSYFKDRDHYSYLDSRDADLAFASAFGSPEELQDLLVLKTRAHDDVDQGQAQLQHIFDSRWVSTVMGYEHVYSDVERYEDSPIFYDEPANIFSGLGQRLHSSADYSLNSDTVYSYLIGHVTSWADVTAGLSYTRLDYENIDVPTFLDEKGYRNAFNPKAGITLYPLDDLTIRGAYFRSPAVSMNENLRRLEPTLVGGINQLYSDLPGTFADNYGVGLDYKRPGRDYLGVEYVHRDLDTDVKDPFLSYSFDFERGAQQAITAVDAPEGRDQDLLNAYLYHVFDKQLVGTLDYRYTRENLAVGLYDLDQRQQRHTTSAALRYFHPSLFFGYARETWLVERNEGVSFLDNANERAWLLDLGVGYRLPNRRGAVMFELLNVTNETVELDQSLGFEEPVFSGIGGRVLASFNF